MTLRIIRTHNKTKAVRNHIHLPRRLCSGSGVRIWIQTPDLDFFQNLTGTSLFKDTSVIKFSSKSDHYVRRYEPNCVIMPYLAMLKNSSKKILDPDLEVDYSQNLISSSLCTDMSGKIYMKIRSVVFT